MTLNSSNPPYCSSYGNHCAQALPSTAYYTSLKLGWRPCEIEARQSGLEDKHTDSDTLSRIALRDAHTLTLISLRVTSHASFALAFRPQASAVILRLPSA